MVWGAGSKREAKGEFEDGMRNWGEGGQRLDTQEGTVWGVEAMNSICGPSHHWGNVATPWTQTVKDG